MKRKPTIRDVAKLANVSSATVSYVQNDVKKVSEKTRLRVLAAIEELNYYPNFTAVSLSKEKSKLIGVILPYIEESSDLLFGQNQYYNEFLSGVELVARKYKFDTLITGIKNHKECKEWVKKRNLDGLIIMGLFPNELYEEMSQLEIPIVLIDTYEKYTKHFSAVQIDDRLGGYLATKHLVELNHKRIAFVATDLATSTVDMKRFEGYKKALDEAGISLNEKFIFETKDITFHLGTEIGREIQNYECGITGIVTVSDTLAIGIIKSLLDSGLKVPDDYSIVGFDDISVSKYISPSLTTIKQDIFEKGRLAANLLVNKEKYVSDDQIGELPIQLMIRDSTKRI